MKKNYLLTLLLTFFCIAISLGQTTLSAGDLIVVSIQADTPDSFRFVPLVDLESGTVIKFTENAWDGTALRTNESTITFTSNVAIDKGTNILFEAGTDDSRFSVSGNLGFSASGDQVLVYQGDEATPTFIFAVQNNSTLWQDPPVTDTNQSALPTGLTDGVNAVAVGAGTGSESEYDNSYYSGTTTGTKADLLANVVLASNWTGSNSVASAITDNFTLTTQSVISMAITSPSDGQVFPSTTINIPVSYNVQNFTLSGDNGSEMSDNTGDGYIVISLTKDGELQGTQNIFTTSETFESPDPGSSYSLTAELVDNSGNSLDPIVEASVNFSVKLPCDLMLGSIDTSCDALTSGTDTFSGSIDFTGGNTGITYTITAPQGVTVGGDDPNSIAEGTITFSGMTEGIDADITIVGGDGSSCDFTRTLYSPTCISLPLSEDFSYADGSLTNNPLWDSFSGTFGDLMVTSGQALVQHGTPSEDAQIQFAAVSGSVYYAFDFKVLDQGEPIPGDDNEYFAMFKDGGSNYKAKLDIVPPTSTGDFTVGIATSVNTADAVWAADLTYGVTYRVTVMYNQDTNIAQLWVDATSDSDTSILGADEEDPGLSIEGFALRQSDSNLNEGILVDNLRIGTTFAETSLSTSNNNLIEGFATYPNPVTNNQFTITSISNERKEISIFNVIGKRVLSTSVVGVKSDVDVSSIASGLYILKVTEGTKTATSKLVIK